MTRLIGPSQSSHGNTPFRRGLGQKELWIRITAKTLLLAT